jgi:hypothetical protein
LCGPEEFSIRFRLARQEADGTPVYAAADPAFKMRDGKLELYGDPVEINGFLSLTHSRKGKSHVQEENQES